MYYRFLKICSVIFLLSLSMSFVHAQTSKYNFSEEENIYDKVPDVRLTTEQGTFLLSDIYSQSPVILAMVFTRCTGICTPFIYQLKQNIEMLQPKEKFKIIVVSFDPLDSAANMQELSRRYKLQDDPNWIFAVNQDIDTLNSVSKFVPIWDEATQQYEHEALLVGVNTNGYITKKLLGLRDKIALKSVIKEINNDLVLAYPLPGTETIFSCFRYDPATGKRKPSYGLLFLLSPAVFGGIMLFWFSRKRKQYEKQGKTID